MKNLSAEFGIRLRSLRMAKKMSQEDLAFRADLSAAHLGQIERAEKKPTLETLGRLAVALDISLAELFSFDEAPVALAEENSVLSKINAQLSQMTDEDQRDILRIIRIFRRHAAKK